MLEEEETDEKTTTGEQNFCQFKGAKFSFLAFSHSLSLSFGKDRERRADGQTDNRTQRVSDEFGWGDLASCCYDCILSWR